MKRRMLGCELMIMVTIIVGTAGAVQGAIIERTAVGGNWSTAGGWDGGVLPGPSDTAVHPQSKGTLTYDAGVTSPNDEIAVGRVG